MLIAQLIIFVRKVDVLTDAVLLLAHKVQNAKVDSVSLKSAREIGTVEMAMFVLKGSVQICAFRLFAQLRHIAWKGLATQHQLDLIILIKIYIFKTSD